MMKYLAIIDFIKREVYYPTDDMDLGFKLDAMIEYYSNILELNVYAYNFHKVWVIKEREGE